MAAESSDTEPLRLAYAAERLGVTTLEMVELVYYRKIRRVLVDGIWHVTPDAIEEYRRREAS